MVEDETVIGLGLSTVYHLRSRLPGHMFLHAEPM